MTRISFVLLLASTSMVFAQGNAPFIAPPANSTSPASALDNLPSKTISNGIVSAKVYGYSLTKTVRIVPGKAQLVIEDRLKNTGKKPIDTTVYNHHFMTLSPGEDGVELEAPFKLTNARPMPADVVKFDGNRMRYLRGLTGQEQVASDLTGFTNAVSDNDFKITDTKSGFGVRIRADLPVSRLLWWSVPSTMGIEPYMDIKLKPGEEMHWSHTMDYYGPGDAK